MSIEKIQSDITTTKQKIEIQGKKLDELGNQIVRELKPYIKQKIENAITNEVKEKSEHTKSLGKERLTELKQSLQSLLAQSDVLMDELYSNDEVWVHKNYIIIEKGDSFGQKYNNQKKADRTVTDPARIVLGRAGKLLSDYGYVKVAPRYSGGHGEWKENERSEVIYGYSIGGFQSSFEKTIKEYIEALGVYHDNIEELTRLEKALSEQEAMDIWDGI